MTPRDHRHPRAAARRCCGDDFAFSDAAVRGDHRAARARRRDRRRRLRQDHGDGRPGGLAGRHRPGRARRGARPHLHHQGHRRARRPGSATACAQAGLLPDRRPRPADGEDDEDEVEEPTVATYHAYAAALLTEHGLRIGHEPDTRLIADASRYQLAARAVQRYTAAGRAAHRLAPTTSSQYLLALDGRDERAPRRPRRRARLRRRASARCSRPAMADEHRKTYREKNEKAIVGDRPAGRAARPGRGLPRPQEPPRADGLLRPDRARRPARRASARRSARSSAAKFKIVLLDEYQDTSVAQALMLSRLFSGPDADAGLGHPVTAVGDPNQAIYGWRGASVSNILEFGRGLPAARRPPRTTYPLTVNRRSDERILATANHLAADALRRCARAAARSSRSPAPRPARCAPSSTRPTTTSWPGWPTRCSSARTRGDDRQPCWTRDRRAHPRQRPRRRVFDALSDREIPVEIVGLKGLLRLPEVSEVVATLDPDPGRHRQRRAAHPARRAAVGDRAARPGAARPPGPRARRRPAAAASEFADRRRRSSRPRSRAPTRPRSPSLCDALDDPGDLAYSAEARERFGAARRRAAPAARGDRRADPRPGPPDHRHHRHRRRARLVGQPGRGRPAATTSTCSSRRSPSSRPSTARSPWPRCWPGSRPRTSSARASTSPPRPRPTRSSC